MARPGGAEVPRGVPAQPRTVDKMVHMAAEITGGCFEGGVGGMDPRVAGKRPGRYELQALAHREVGIGHYDAAVALASEQSGEWPRVGAEQYQ